MMLFEEHTKNECVPDCGQCKNIEERSHTILRKVWVNSQILASPLLV